jgi:hypothetical protein
MTQTALLEAVQGPDVAMKQYEELFSTYTHLTYKLGLSPQQLLLKQLENEVPPSPSTPSRKSSISLLRRTSDSSFSSLTGRRRSSSVEEKKSPVDTNGSLRRAESDTDDMSDDSTMTGSTITRSSSRRLRKHSRKMQRSESVRVDSAESRKKSLQLIDLGMARRIGTAAAAPAQHNGTSSRQGKSINKKNRKERVILKYVIV